MFIFILFIILNLSSCKYDFSSGTIKTSQFSYAVSKNASNTKIKASSSYSKKPLHIDDLKKEGHAVLFVKTTGDNKNSGLSWENAVKSPNLALSIADSYRKDLQKSIYILIEQGTYEFDDCVLNLGLLYKERYKNIYILGGFKENETDIEKYAEEKTIFLGKKDQKLLSLTGDCQNIHIKGLNFNGNGGECLSINNPKESPYLDSLIFENCKSQNGGAIYADLPGKDFLIKNSFFINNHATKNGGAIYIKKARNVEFINDKITLHSMYQAFLQRKTDQSIPESLRKEEDIPRFYNNKAQNNGGALYLKNINGQININNQVIIKNTAGQDGGGIYINNTKNKINILDNLISYNNAKGNGGGIFINLADEDILIKSSTIYFKNSHLIKLVEKNLFNTYTVTDHFVYISLKENYVDKTAFVFNGYESYGLSLIQNNHAGKNGGFIYVENLGTITKPNAFIRLENIFFNQNKSTLKGGTLYINEYAKKVVLFNSLINKSVAQNCSAMYIKAINYKIFAKKLIIQESSVHNSESTAEDPIENRASGICADGIKHIRFNNSALMNNRYTVKSVATYPYSAGALHWYNLPAECKTTPNLCLFEVIDMLILHENFGNFNNLIIPNEVKNNPTSFQHNVNIYKIMDPITHIIQPMPLSEAVR